MKHVDGIDVAIAAFVAERLTGGSTEDATRNAEAILDLFGIERNPRPKRPSEYRKER